MPAFDIITKIFSFFFLKRKISSMKIKAAKAYVLGIKKIRLFLLGAMLALVSLVLLASGIFLIHAAFFTYSDWTADTKFTVAIVLGTFEFLGAAVILFFLFREETWVRFTEVTHVVNSVVGQDNNKSK